MIDEQLEAYLARIGAERPAKADAESLRELQQRHLYAVPFENLSIHLGERISLDEGALLDKIVGRRRGGFCYELNGAFAGLLRALGFDVTLLAAKVCMPDGRLGPPFDHLVLRVDLDEPWLADVGFGAHARVPLRISPEPQEDVEGTFSVHQTSSGDLEVRNGERPLFQAETRPRELAEFAPTCWWQATSPESHFTRSLTCSLPTPDGGRVTLSGSKLIETAPDGQRTESVLSDDELPSTYQERFGFELNTLPELLH